MYSKRIRQGTWLAIHPIIEVAMVSCLPTSSYKHLLLHFPEPGGYYYLYSVIPQQVGSDGRGRIRGSTIQRMHANLDLKALRFDSSCGVEGRKGTDSSYGIARGIDWCAGCGTFCLS